jgi:hypothetical protein
MAGVGMKAICKKCKGAGDVLVGIFVLIMLFVVLAMFLNIENDFKKKAQLDSIVREYALIAETQGGLTGDNKKAMIADINSIGDFVKNGTAGDAIDDDSIKCDAAGTLGYGAEGKITVNCAYKNYYSRLISNVFGLGNDSNLSKSTVSITKTYTSKY